MVCLPQSPPYAETSPFLCLRYCPPLEPLLPGADLQLHTHTRKCNLRKNVTGPDQTHTAKMFGCVYNLTEVADAGPFRGVKVQFEEGLCPLAQPRFFLSSTELIGLKTLQLETCIFPQGSENRKLVVQYFLSIHTNADLKGGKRRG